MSRWITLALAVTSTLALTTVAAPASTWTTSGSNGTRIGGSWCC